MTTARNDPSRPSWGALLLLCVGCEATGVLLVPLPDGAMDRASILAVFSGNELVRVEGFPAGAERWYVADLAEGESVRFEALMYAATLEDLGLSPGKIALAPDNQGREWPPDYRAVESKANQDRAESWVDLAKPRIVDYPLDIPGECAALDGDRRLLALTSTALRTITCPASFGFPLDERRAIFGFEGRLYVADGNAAEAVRFEPAERAELGFTSGDVNEGRVWLGTRSGELWVGPATLPLTLTLAATSPNRSSASISDACLGIRATSTSSQASLGEIIRSVSAQGDSVYAIVGGRIGRKKDRSFELVGAQTFDPTSEYAAIETLGPTEAIAAGGQWRGALRVDGDRVEEEPFPENQRASSLIRLSGNRVFSGTWDGDILARERNGLWVLARDISLPESPIVRGLAPFLDGFVYGGNEGFLGQYSPATGYCGEQIVLSHEGGVIVALPHALAICPRVKTGLDSISQTDVSWLRLE
ncbi:MAG: hypothetical protein HYV07_01390 [Deltaproteobacteria bacterium]|nr:hypothetical protein [Deltaproteobacteria bacterium]